MSTPMNPIDERLCEQLCAYMDDELPADEARFLERRLGNEPALRAKWERMQLASACLKGQSFRPMSMQLSSRVAEALATPAQSPSRRWRVWATAASIALLALAFAPRMFQSGSSDHGIDQSVPMVATSGLSKPAPSPSSADLVASAVIPVESPMPAQTAPRPATGHVATTNATATHDLASTSQSPADFPLVESASSRTWPRAELPGAANDPSIEAYLVRHNQMLANDGLGGFVPYVDVVTNTPTPTADGGDNSQ